MTEFLPRKMNMLSILKWQTPLPSWYIDKHQILYVVHVFLYSTYFKKKAIPLSVNQKLWFRFHSIHISLTEIENFIYWLSGYDRKISCIEHSVQWLGSYVIFTNYMIVFMLKFSNIPLPFSEVKYVLKHKGTALKIFE